MKALSITCLLVFCSTSIQAQLKQPLSSSNTDSLPAEFSFIPNNFLANNLEFDVPTNSTFSPKFKKTLKTTGWLIKDVLLRNKFDGTGFYPHTSMLYMDTQSVTEYNSIYHNYPFSFNL
jgi:hypothetical protein